MACKVHTLDGYSMEKKLAFQMQIHLMKILRIFDDADGVDEYDGFDAIQDLLGDMLRASFGTVEQENQGGGRDGIVVPNKDAVRFDRLLRSAQRELYPGCTGHSVLSFLLKLVHLKDSNRWSSKPFDMLLKLLKDVLPTGTRRQEGMPSLQGIKMENTLRKALEDLDRKYPWLAQDPCNVLLGVATDGFNPFRTMSSSYSVWHVVLVVYNLPPWRSMEEPFLLMTLLITGKKVPGRDIDVYLRPAVDELKLIFDTGVSTFDASMKECFKMHVMLLWTIHDLPAYGAVFEYSTMGYDACPVCLDKTYSQPLRNKIDFTGHRRYLPIHHRWRTSKAFNTKHDNALQPKQLSGNEIFALLQKLDHLQGFKYGNTRNTRNRKHARKRTPGRNFTKINILFELPYWKDLQPKFMLDPSTNHMVAFKTKVFHPNINSNGSICLLQCNN